MSKFRFDDLFLRNGFEKHGPFNIPLVKKQELDVDSVSLISFADTKSSESKSRTLCGVHFFQDDYKFECVYNNPYRYIKRLLQYKFVLTPDFSTYADMDMWRQIESVGKNRWCGAFWQSQGMTVFPTVSWSTARSFDFCFDGIEHNSVVAVGMVGCKSDRFGFMRGYDAMLERIEPEAVICLGTPFPEMRGNLLVVPYTPFRKVVV